jgi:hypothetical protein
MNSAIPGRAGASPPSQPLTAQSLPITVILPSAAGRLSFPFRGQQPSSSFIYSSNPWFIQIDTVPKFAGYRTMRLVQRLAIVRIGTTPDLLATPEFHFYEPVRVRQRLTCEANDIGVAVSQY